MSITRPKVKLISHTMNPEMVVACAGKLCYSKVGIDDLLENLNEESIEKFINLLTSLGHESPLEHVSFTFGIEGISRACSHQIVRHRIASYSQQSQRYVNLVDSFEYIVPPRYQNDEFLLKVYEDAMREIEVKYKQLVSLSISRELSDLGYSEKYAQACREGNTYESLADYVKANHKKIYSRVEKECIEDARYVLPNACETKMVVTMNARSLLNFFAHRSCERAQWEIREVSDLMIILVREICKTLFKNAGPNCVIGPCPEGKMSCGKIMEKRKKFLVETSNN